MLQFVMNKQKLHSLTDMRYGNNQQEFTRRKRLAIFKNKMNY